MMISTEVILISNSGFVALAKKAYVGVLFLFVNKSFLTLNITTTVGKIFKPYLSLLS